LSKKKLSEEEVYRLYSDSMAEEERIFDDVIASAESKGMRREAINELKLAFQEYKQVCSQVIKEKGLDFSMDEVRVKIPGNVWLYLLDRAIEKLDEEEN